MKIKGESFSDEVGEFEFREYESQSSFPKLSKGNTFISFGIVFFHIKKMPIGDFFNMNFPAVVSFMCFN